MKPRVAISLGDPKGIGPEVVARALEHRSVKDAVLPVVYGDSKLLAAPYFWDCSEAEAARHAALALTEATDALLAGEVDALATAPLHKAALIDVPGGPFMGHTGYLAYRCQGTPLMCFVHGGLRMALLTVHVPLSEVAKVVAEIGSSGVVRRLTLMARGLEQDLGVVRPRLALLGLNPHAGEGGLLGVEESRYLAPAVQAAREQGLDITGPLPADGLFHTIAGGSAPYDGVLACYHDQGLVGFKALCPNGGAQLSLGLKVVRTSCKHGTGRDIAGQGQADPKSMVDAIVLAGQIAQRRRAAQNANLT